MDRKIRPISVDFPSFVADAIQHVEKTNEYVIMILYALRYHEIHNRKYTEGNPRKHFVSPNNLEVRDSRIRIAYKKRKKEMIHNVNFRCQGGDISTQCLIKFLQFCKRNYIPYVAVNSF